MLATASRRRPLLTVSLGLLSGVLFQLGLVGIVFLVPLQLAGSRGRGALWGSSALSLAVIVGGQEAMLLWSGLSRWGVLEYFAVGMAFTLIGGWLLIDGLKSTGWRFLTRLTVALAAVGVILFPIAWLMMSSPSVQAEISLSFAKFWHSILTSGGTTVDSWSSLIPTAWLKNSDLILKMFEEALLSSVLLGYFFLWLLTWRLTRATPVVSESGEVVRKEPFYLRNFRLPSTATWVFLLSWAIYLAVVLLEKSDKITGFWQYPLLNIAWITLLIHALAGGGVVQSLMIRWNWPALFKTIVSGLLLVFCLWFGSALEMGTLVFLSVLAVLELWVNFRNFNTNSEERL